METGPSPSGQSFASHKVPNLHRLSVKATPKVSVKPNSAPASKRPKNLGGGGASISRGGY